MKLIRNLLVTAAIAVLTAGCSVSTEDLAAEVEADMAVALAERNIEIKSFMLTHRGGNEYKGILETVEPFGEFTYSVEVIFDGDMFTWEIS